MGIERGSGVDHDAHVGPRVRRFPPWRSTGRRLVHLDAALVTDHQAVHPIGTRMANLDVAPQDRGLEGVDLDLRAGEVKSKGPA